MQTDSDGHPDVLTASASDPDPDRNGKVVGPRRARLRELLGRAPDPTASRELLSALRDSSDDDTRWLANSFYLDSDLQDRKLRELLPGLGLVESPYFSTRLSVRAANVLIGANAGTLSALAGTTPVEILALPNLGRRSVAEILLVVLGEWASSYLASVEDHPPRRERTRHGVSADADDPEAERRRLSDLADAFSELEEGSAFFAFRRRQLDDERPSQAAVAEQLGVSGSRISHLERATRALLAKQMREKESPIAAAVSEVQERLGSVAFKKELEHALESVDPTGGVLSDALPHRRVLVLKLADYRISGEWVLGPDIELLTKAVLDGLTENGPADLDFVGRHLGRLGIRKVLRMPWIINQPGFQIADGRVLRSS